jgi:hypothetical protein
LGVSTLIALAPVMDRGADRGRSRSIRPSVAQVDRIEVELQIIQQWHPAERHDGDADDDRDAVVFHELVDRPEEREAERLRFALRVQDREQRG